MLDIARPALLATQRTGIDRAKFQAPPADTLIRDDNAPIEQHFLDKTKAQREAKIQPHRMSYQFMWKLVPFKARTGRSHRPRLPCLTLRDITDSVRQE
ncbi:hypothetical protein QE368_000979 [Asaia bogorensis NBRC 16594]|nr:hypothetical protein [Asaia bogorensis NBRC 16594]